MSTPESIYVKLDFHPDSSSVERDSDHAYLSVKLSRLIQETSAFKSYRVLTDEDSPMPDSSTLDVRVSVTAYLTDCPPWDTEIDQALIPEIAEEICRKFDPTSIYDQIDQLGCLILRERGLSISSLKTANGGHWGEHPEHLLVEWRADVAEDCTRLGYWEWVDARICDAEEGEMSNTESISSLKAANGGHWGEHPEHLLCEWRADVPEDRTRLGYWEWVDACICDAEEDQ
jgi:hypothetical protein